MSTETSNPDSLNYSIPKIGAEAGFEPDQAPTPIRATGFISLLFGVLSILCLLGRPLLVLPFAAIAFALIALRPSGQIEPIGKTPAKVALVLAAAFGACGFFLPFFKDRVLGGEGAEFGRQYLELIADGEYEYALELGKEHYNRHVASLPLKDLYRRDADLQETITRFLDEEAVGKIVEAGPDAQWILLGTPSTFVFNQIDRVETIWTDSKGILSDPIRLILEYRVANDTGKGQWHVDKCEIKKKPLIAERRT